MSDITVGLDIGTTSVKGIAVAPDGEVAAKPARRSRPAYWPRLADFEVLSPKRAQH